MRVKKEICIAAIIFMFSQTAIAAIDKSVFESSISDAALQPGTHIVAGQPGSNDFFIVADNHPRTVAPSADERPAVSAALTPTVASASAVVHTEAKVPAVALKVALNKALDTSLATALKKVASKKMETVRSVAAVKPAKQIKHVVTGKTFHQAEQKTIGGHRVIFYEEYLHKRSLAKVTVHSARTMAMVKKTLLKAKLAVHKRYEKSKVVTAANVK